MMLFAKDWLRFTDAIADYKTPNRSFYRLSMLYKEMGLKNHLFPLTLFQRELVGVDPFDPNLTHKQKSMILRECIFNPWYYFREVVRLPPNAGVNPIPFIANRANISMIWCFFNHIDYLLIQPRQTGKSGSTDTLIQGLMTLWTMNTRLFLVTKDHNLRAANIERLKGLREYLPDYIYYPNKTDVNNTEMMTVNDRGNRLLTGVSQSSESGAVKLGRGLTTPVLIFDEFAYINHIEISLPAALAAGSAARDQAREEGQPYGSVFLTTAGDINKRDGRYAHDFMMSGTEWAEGLLDSVDEQDLRDKVRRNAGKAGRVLINGTFNHLQLGKSDEWILQKINESSGSKDQAERDFLNAWTTGGEGSVIHGEDKRRMLRSQRDPNYSEITEDGFIIHWFIDQREIQSRMNSSHFIIGLDTSEALGGDNDAIGLVMIDVKNHEVVAIGRYNETNTSRFAIFLANFLVKYPNTTLIFERRSTGSSIYDTMVLHLIVKNVDPFRRIYNRVVDEPDNFRLEYEDIQRARGSQPSGYIDRYKRHFGFATSGGTGKFSRNGLYSESLHSMMRHGAHRLNSKLLISELAGLQSNDGRIDHKNSGHDDLVIAALLAHWFCIKAKNLQFYGIDARSVLIDSADLEQKSEEERYDERRKAQRREEFNQAIKELEEATSVYDVNRLERKLRAMSVNVNVEEITGVSIDAFLEQLRELQTRDYREHQHQSMRQHGIRPSRHSFRQPGKVYV